VFGVGEHHREDFLDSAPVTVLSVIDVVNRSRYL
jgi:hypothetical protein